MSTDAKTGYAVLDAIRGVLNTIRNMMANLVLNDAQKQTLYSELDILKEAERMWIEGIKVAAENKNASVSKDTQYALKSYTDAQLKRWENSRNIVIYKNEKQLSEFIDDAISKKNLNKKMYFGVIDGALAEGILSEAGIDVFGYNCVLRASEIHKIIRDHGTVDSEEPRGQRKIEKTDFMNIVKIIEEADDISGDFEGYEGNGESVTFEKNINGKTRAITYKALGPRELHLISLYGWKEKKSLATAADVQASALTPETNNGTARTNIVGHKNPEVKEQHSRKDSEGNTLTEDQANYFRESKVRDENGNLLVMYHGTEGEFSVFKANEFIEEINGLSRIKGYFSTSEEYAEAYGDVTAYYLNITNSLYIPDEGKSLEEWPKWFAEHGVPGVKLDTGIEKEKLKGYTQENGPTLYALWDLFDYGSYWDGNGNLTEAIQNAGYDGIYWQEGEGYMSVRGGFIDGVALAYMPFNENAIKKIDNLHPTENADTQFSRKYTPEEEQQHRDEMAKELEEGYGSAYTLNFSQAGYILPDGNEANKLLAMKYVQKITQVLYAFKQRLSSARH